MPYEISARVKGVTGVVAPNPVNLEATKEVEFKKERQVQKTQEVDLLAR